MNRDLGKKGKNPRNRLGYLVLVLMLALTGCASTDGGVQQTSSDDLVLAIGGEPENGFDPTTGWGRYGSPLFQSTLLKRDSELRIGNDLATDYTVSQDGLIWTVHLREDARFSDGEPLTAEDVVFTFETASAAGSVIDLTNLEKVEATDTYTVRFMLKEPRSTFVTSLLTVGIVPKHAYGPEYASYPIGSGPYRLVQWDRGQQLIVEANPAYYGEQPFFQRVTFLFLGEDAAFAAAKAGQVDVSYIPSAFSQQAVEGMRLEAVHSVDNRGILFPYVKPGQITEDGYPIGNAVTADAAIRKAVNVAVDREALVDGVLEGYGSPAFTANDGLPWWNPETVVDDGNVERAKQILEDSGWTDTNGDGVVEKDGLTAAFTLLYPAGDSTRQSLALAAADMVRRAGIDIRVEGKSWAEIGKRMHADAVLFGWGSHDPLEMYHLYSSAYRGVDYFNAGYYSNPVVDEWMAKALRASSEEEANRYWQKAQWDGETGLSARGDAAWAWLVNIDHLYLVSEDLDIGKQRIQPHAHGWPVTDNLTEWTRQR